MIADLKVQSQDTVASLGNSDLDGLRADCRGSDNLVADDRDDLVVAAARQCWVVARNRIGNVKSESKNILVFAD